MPLPDDDTKPIAKKSDRDIEDIREYVRDYQSNYPVTRNNR
jgi:hypothetical protein